MEFVKNSTVTNDKVLGLFIPLTEKIYVQNCEHYKFDFTDDIDFDLEFKIRETIFIDTIFDSIISNDNEQNVILLFLRNNHSHYKFKSTWRDPPPIQYFEKKNEKISKALTEKLKKR